MPSYKTLKRRLTRQRQKARRLYWRNRSPQDRLRTERLVSLFKDIYTETVLDNAQTDNMLFRVLR